jgi:hypothetical protein
MNNKLFYQIRIYFSSEFTNIYKNKIRMEAKDKLLKILRKHNADLLSQYDGFMGYILKSEKENNINTPLYKWTKDSLKNTSKVDKYHNSYTIYVNSEEVYSKEVADSLENHLTEIVDGKFIIRISKHDTNPVNNPQPPSKYYK